VRAYLSWPAKWNLAGGDQGHDLEGSARLLGGSAAGRRPLRCMTFLARGELLGSRGELLGSRGELLSSRGELLGSPGRTPRVTHGED
jgi:hypothetical protein